MCGIIGYIGKNNAKEVVYNGLLKLEYRGYDSAGMTLYNHHNHVFDTFREVGRVANLKTATTDLFSNIGIGHTRWATHGKVNQENTHPHRSFSGRFIVVHNGVIENYLELKKRYLKSHTFSSETDTEVIAYLIDEFSKSFDTMEAITNALKLLMGSYALLIIDTMDPNTIYAAKNKPPLLLGIDNNGVTISSDILALVNYASKYLIVDDKTFVKISDKKVSLFDYNLKKITPNYQPFDFDFKEQDLNGFQHYMIKEIHEQPMVIRKIISKYFINDTLSFDKKLIESLKSANKIYIIASGSSMHAGLIGKKIFEAITNKLVEVHIASEFAYDDVKISENPFFILVSQSGETADLRACLTKINIKNYETLTITNVITSTLAREAKYQLELFAGVEISVASTKAYSAQIVLLSLLAYAISDELIDIKKELSLVANGIENILENKNIIKKIAKKIIHHQHLFYIGRGIDYLVSLEAALKLKEISYIHTEGFAAGELKHGTIALIEEGTPVIGIISSKLTNLNTRSNLKEVESRGALVITIAQKNLSIKEDDIIVDDCLWFLSPLLTVVPAQLIAYYASLYLGYDIDKPRNLAKSVTVE